MLRSTAAASTTSAGVATTGVAASNRSTPIAARLVGRVPGRVDDLAFASAEETAALVRTGARARARSWRPRCGASRRSTRRSTPSSRSTANARSRPPTPSCPAPTQPFAGVPIAIKGNIPVEGYESNSGSRFLAGYRPDHSAYLVRRLREAGFVIVGITNLPEFGILPTTEPRHTGPTRNPWDLDRTPGRLERRLRRGGRRGHGAARARQRRRRLDPHPRRVLRARRPQAEPRARLQRARSRRLVAGGQRRPHAHRGRHRDRARRPRRLRGRRRQLGAAPDRALRDRRCGARPGSCAWRSRPRTRSTRAVDPEAIHGLRVGAELLAALGHEVVEAAPAWPRPDALESSSTSSARRSRSGSTRACCATAASRARTSSSRSPARSTSARGRRRRSPTSAPSRRCRRSRAGWSPSSPTTTC